MRVHLLIRASKQLILEVLWMVWNSLKSTGWDGCDDGWLVGLVVIQPLRHLQVAGEQNCSGASWTRHHQCISTRWGTTDCSAATTGPTLGQVDTGHH